MNTPSNDVGRCDHEPPRRRESTPDVGGQVDAPSVEYVTTVLLLYRGTMRKIGRVKRGKSYRLRVCLVRKLKQAMQPRGHTGAAANAEMMLQVQDDRKKTDDRINNGSATPGVSFSCMLTIQYSRLIRTVFWGTRAECHISNTKRNKMIIRNGTNDLEKHVHFDKARTCERRGRNPCAEGSEKMAFP